MAKQISRKNKERFESMGLEQLGDYIMGKSRNNPNLSKAISEFVKKRRK